MVSHMLLKWHYKGWYKLDANEQITYKEDEARIIFVHR